MSDQHPILYSFRRCPYAMRARMALHVADITVEHREILLKNKPPEMLASSAKGTVPVLVLTNGTVVDESWDVMCWALEQSDPENWLGESNCWLKQSSDLVLECDNTFKQALDRYKYSDRHPHPPEIYRQEGMEFLGKLERLLEQKGCLLTSAYTIADYALMPFVRQFAHVDKDWFNQCELRLLSNWLDTLINSDIFRTIMIKQPLWKFESH